MKQKGYTLIELVITIGILAIVGGIVLATVFTAANTANKSQEIDTVRQNGNYAISQIEKTLRYAESFDGISNDYVNYKSCQKASGIQYYVNYSTFDPPPNKQNRFVCWDWSSAAANISFINLTTGQDSKLLDTSKVQLTTCSITCVPSPDNKTTLELEFTLTQVGASIRGNQTTIPFRTSVTFRNSF